MCDKTAGELKNTLQQLDQNEREHILLTLPRHLAMVDQHESLSDILRNWAFLVAKMNELSVSLLLDDLDIARDYLHDSYFDGLYTLIRRYSHLLQPAAMLKGCEATFYQILWRFSQTHVDYQGLRAIVPRPFLSLTVMPQDFTSPALRQTILAHDNIITDCAISPDGHKIVTTSWDNTVKVWDSTSGDLLQVLPGHTDHVNGCAISADGRWIASAASDKTIRIWNLITGETRQVFQHYKHAFHDCLFSPDGKFIFSLAADRTVTMWHITSGAALATFGMLSYQDMIFTTKPDGSLLILDSFERERLISSERDFVFLRFDQSPGGQLLAAPFWDGTLKIWDTGSGDAKHTIGKHQQTLMRVLISDDARLSITTAWDGVIKAWDLATGDERYSIQAHTGPIIACAFNKTADWFVSGSNERMLKIWDAATGSLQATLSGHTEQITACVIAPEDDYLVSTARDRMIKIWNLNQLTSDPRSVDPAEPVYDCVLSQDETTLVVHTWDRIDIWDVSTHTRQQSISVEDYTAGKCAIAGENEEYILSASHTIVSWQRASGDEYIHIKEDDLIAYSSCLVIDNGNALITTTLGRQHINVFDIQTGDKLRSFEGHEKAVLNTAKSNDETLLASVSYDKTVKVWNLKTGAEIYTFQGHTSTTSCCAISPDKQFLVSGSYDGVLKVWDLSHYTELHTLSGHTGSIRSCVISPDNQYIFSTSDDGTLRMWNSRTGEFLSVFVTEGDLRKCLILSDSTSLILVGYMGLYRLQIID